ncbi:N-acetylglucosamine-6-phosphate deacetylase [Mariniluteicoccus flavus]
MSEHIEVAYAVTPDAVVEGARIVVEGDRIAAVEPTGRRGGDAGEWALPGFVDTHTHGAVGHDFGDADADGVRAMLDFQRSRGATSVFASLATNTLDHLERQVALLADFVEAGELAGIHLEGPFLAAERKGAHAAELLRDPDPVSVARLLEAGRGTVAMVTLAPERDHATEAIAAFRAAGVRVAFGHSDADAALCRSAIDAGARVATHLFNAMRGIHHREPGPVPALLDDPRVAVELICDGVHLHDDVIRLAVAAAGPERVILITDAMAATGLSDGDYTLGALRARVVGDVARILEEDGSLGAIAGSTLTMDRAVAHAVRLGTPLPAVAAMAASTPARVHGLGDVGALVPGRYADLVLTDAEGRPHRVMRRGRWLTPAG